MFSLREKKKKKKKDRKKIKIEIVTDYSKESVSVEEARKDVLSIPNILNTKYQCARVCEFRGILCIHFN